MASTGLWLQAAGAAKPVITEEPWPRFCRAAVPTMEQQERSCYAAPMAGQEASTPLNQPTTQLCCRECGYDLYGQDRDARCPECGYSVAATLENDDLAYADARWLRRVAWSLRMLHHPARVLGIALASLLILAVIFMVGGMLMVVFDWGLPSRVFDGLAAAALVVFTVGGLSVVGLLLPLVGLLSVFLLSDEPGRIEPAPYVLLRQVGRVCAVVLGFGPLVLMFQPMTLPPLARSLGGYLLAALLACWLLAMHARLGNLARRLRLTPIKRSRRQMWDASAILAAALLAAGATLALHPQPQAPLNAPPTFAEALLVFAPLVILFASLDGLSQVGRSAGAVHKAIQERGLGSRGDA